MTIFSAATDREAVSHVAFIRKPEEVLALFKTTERNDEGAVYRVVSLDAGRVETLCETQTPGAPDAVEVHATTFARPGETLLSVH